MILSAVLGLMFLPRMGKRVALVIGLRCRIVHWALDLVVHRPDMPILLGNYGHLPLLGFGLWTHPAIAALLELLLVTAGSLTYWRAARETAAEAGQGGKWAAISAALIATFGLLVLSHGLYGLRERALFPQGPSSRASIAFR